MSAGIVLEAIAPAFHAGVGRDANRRHGPAVSDVWFVTRARLYQLACLEGNDGLLNILMEARAQERAAAR
jgi:hypothetical protein